MEQNSQFDTVHAEWWLTISIHCCFADLSSTTTWQSCRLASSTRCLCSRFCAYLWQRHNTLRKAPFLCICFCVVVGWYLFRAPYSFHWIWLIDLWSHFLVVSIFHCIFTPASSLEIKVLCPPPPQYRFQDQPRVAGHFHLLLSCRPLNLNDLTELPVGIFDSLSQLNFL